MSVRKAAGVGAGVLMVAGLVGAACGGGVRTAPPVVVGKGRVPAATPGRVGGMRGVAEGPGRGEDGSILGEFTLPQVTTKVVKTATLSIEVVRGRFDQQFEQATLVAARHGGFVASSRVTAGRHPRGTLVIRVPASQFEATLAELRRLGTVTGEDISGQDVTAQYVDLQARLRNWEAQEVVLLRLMRQSTSIEDSLKVQRALQDVQLAIEEIRGQLRVLDDQTEMSTISLSLTERGVPPVPRPPTGISFSRAWQLALRGSMAVFAAVVVGLGYLVPIGLIGGALALGWLGFRRARTRAVPS
jgi:hypothetical protein